MAQDFDIQFTDGGGNIIEGSCEMAGREGRSLGNAFEHLIARSVKSSSRRAAGRLKHRPVKIWKAIDKASPVLAQGFYNNMRFESCTIRFWRPEPDGTESNYFTCYLERVHIASHTVKQLHNQFENAIEMSVPTFDVFELVYEDITYTYEEDGLKASTGWDAKRA